METLETTFGVKCKAPQGQGETWGSGDPRIYLVVLMCTSDGGSVGSKKELEKRQIREAIPWHRQVGDGDEHFLAALRRV